MRRFVLALLLFVWPIAVCADNVVLITSMRIQPSPTTSIITFDMTAKAAGVVRFVPDEKKLIVKFENTSLKFKVNNARLRGANIISFSAREFSDASTEFYFMTKGKVKWTVNYETDNKTFATRMRLQIQSVDEPAREPQVIGRARWEKFQEDLVLAKSHIFTVVVDAGHGGKDSGAIGKRGTKEKTVVLSIAKKLVRELEKIPGIRVVQTRSGDYYVPLRARLNIARNDRADLFIAVHADAYFNHQAAGASVYALSQHGATSEASRWLARQENYSELDGIEFDSLQDRSRVLRSVLIDMAQTATIRDSLRVGNKVLAALDRVSSLHHRQVEQAPFVVLKSPDIPSILVETGFITNSQQEMQLINLDYQDKIAAAICHGVKSYIKKYAGH